MGQVFTKVLAFANCNATSRGQRLALSWTDPATFNGRAHNLYILRENPKALFQRLVSLSSNTRRLHHMSCTCLGHGLKLPSPHPQPPPPPPKKKKAKSINVGICVLGEVQAGAPKIPNIHGWLSKLGSLFGYPK